MSDFISLLRSRRSIRRFTGEPLAAETLAIIEEALLRAPSSRDLRPWEFVFVRDAGLLRTLAQCKPHGAAFLANATCAIVICADERQSDVWVEDCSIAAIFAQLTAHSLGLGSCWAQVRNRDRSTQQSAEAYIRDVLGLSDQTRVECIIGLGHPAEDKPAISAEDLPRDKIRSSCP